MWTRDPLYYINRSLNWRPFGFRNFIWTFLFPQKNWNGCYHTRFLNYLKIYQDVFATGLPPGQHTREAYSHSAPLTSYTWTWRPLLGGDGNLEGKWDKKIEGVGNVGYGRGVEGWPQKRGLTGSAIHEIQLTPDIVSWRRDCMRYDSTIRSWTYSSQHARCTKF